MVFSAMCDNMVPEEIDIKEIPGLGIGTDMVTWHCVRLDRYAISSTHEHSNL